MFLRTQNECKYFYFPPSIIFITPSRCGNVHELGRVGTKHWNDNWPMTQISGSVAIQDPHKVKCNMYYISACTCLYSSHWAHVQCYMWCSCGVFETLKSTITLLTFINKMNNNNNNNDNMTSKNRRGTAGEVTHTVQTTGVLLKLPLRAARRKCPEEEAHGGTQVVIPASRQDGRGGWWSQEPPTAAAVYPLPPASVELLSLQGKGPLNFLHCIPIR